MKKITAYILILCLLSVSAIMPVSANDTTPFKDLHIPGEIWMSDFDNGGAGVAYKAAKTLNGDSDYRAGEKLSLFNMDYGISVALSDLMWTKYTVNIKETGYYMPVVYYATPVDNVEVEFFFDDVELTSGFLNPTPDYRQCFSQEFDPVLLEAGTKVMKFHIKTGGGTFYKFDFKKTEAEKGGGYAKKDGSYRTHILPTKIEAEDYDLGATGCHSLDGKNNGKIYRKEEPIDIYKSDEGYYISLQTGEYTDYSFVVPYSGSYELRIVASGSVIQCSFDDSDYKLEIPVKSIALTEMSAGVFYLEKGTHKIRLSSENNLQADYIKFTVSKEPGVDVKTLNETAGEEEEVEKDTVTPVFKNLYVSASGSDAGTGEETSPFKTIKRAKEEVAKISADMDGDIVVNILPGYYPIAETEVFGTEHSGKNGFNVIFRGTNILDAPVLSGGTEVKGWEPHTKYIWKAPLDTEEVRNLYVNGYLSKRASSKYRYTPTESYLAEGSKNVLDGVKLSAVNFPDSFARPDELELVWDMSWTSQRTPVQDILYEDGQAIIIMDQPYYNWARTREYDTTKPGVGGRFFIENAMELLDEPGEFYYNKDEKTIYYYPFKNEKLNECETYVGTTEVMFSVLGDGVNDRVENIVFDNLDIRYGAWNELSTTGMVVTQADKILDGPDGSNGHGGTIPPAQLNLKYADNIKILNCEFSCLGSGAIAMTTGVSEVDMIGNSIHDISGTGIIVGSWDHNIPTEGMEQCHDIDIINNAIVRVAREFRGSCGISVYYERNVNIFHNHLEELPYTGITLGWGWGEAADFGNIKVSYNRIENCIIPPIYDGAHIYTLGPLRNCELSYNYLKDTESEFGGIYPDSGSAYMEVHDNVIEGCNHWFYGGLYKTEEMKVYNNYSDTATYYDYGQNDIEPAKVTTDGNWPEEARTIIEKAGLEPRYKRLLGGLEYPEWRTNFVKTMPKDDFKASVDGGWIEAEDFNEGGEGVGYHKLAKGSNTLYREGDVIIYSVTGGAYVIGTTFPGEWLAYDVTIPASGEYAIKTKAANAHHKSGGAEPYFNVYVDGELVLANAPIKQTENWQAHVEGSIGTVYMTEGKHEVRLEFSGNGPSFDAFKFVEADKADLIEHSIYYDEGVIVKEEDLITFTDIEGHWAEDIILEMEKTGIVNGIGNKLFAPEATLTREQAAVLVLRISKISENCSFEEAVSLGIAETGKNKTEMISREEFTAMIMKAKVAKNGSFTIQYGKQIFRDESKISEKYKNYVLGAYQLKIAQGSDDGCFYPQKGLTRAEATVMISRFE